MIALKDAIAQSMQNVPDAFKSVMAQSIAQLRESGIEDRALKTGQQAPDFCLKNQHDESVRLYDLLEEGPVVINFYRGEWCPICQFEFKALEAVAGRIEALGARMISISPELPSQRSGAVGDDFEKLHDAFNGVGLRYGLVFRLCEEFQQVHRDIGVDLARIEGNDSWFLQIPATYIVDRDVTIVMAFIDIDYSHRVEPDDIVRKLEKLQG